MSSERRLNRAGTDALARGVVRLEAADESQRSLRVLVLVERARPRAYTSRSRSELRLDANEIRLTGLRLTVIVYSLLRDLLT